MEDPEAKLAIEKKVAGRNFYKIVARNANAVSFIVVISCEIALCTFDMLIWHVWILWIHCGSDLARLSRN